MSTKGERLIAARKQAKFDSAQEAAEHFGWPVSTYKSHEKAESDASSARSFGLEDAEKYALAFKVDAKTLYYGDKSPSAGVIHSVNRKLTYRPNAAPGRGTVAVSSRQLQVLGHAIGGADGRFLMNGEAIDYVMCPPSLENVPGAYSIYVVGDSMDPRYKAGEIVYVHPNKPYRRGDCVVVQILDEENRDGPPLGYIKEFVSMTPTRLILAQYNPREELEFERNTVVSVHKIVLGGDS